MSNHILNVSVENRSLDPVSAEVWITVRPEQLTPATELRGRLMGPSCPYSNTVEIAYPLMPLNRAELPELGTLRCRVVIPEASLWDPQSPFLYAGPVELWQDGSRCDRVHVRHGLRQFSLGPRGLRINGKLMPLDGRSVDFLTEAQALQLRKQGCNLLLAPLRDYSSSIWEMGERLGFLILGQANPGNVPSTELFFQLSCRPCCLGWLLWSEDVSGIAPKACSGLLTGCGTAVAGARFQACREGEQLILRAGEVVLGSVSLLAS